MGARFDWTALGGEAFAATLTATERRVVEALDPCGRAVHYAHILRRAWPDRVWGAAPTNAETQMLRAHATRLRPKVATQGYELVTRKGYGMALQPVQDGVRAAVQLDPRNAAVALKYADFMATKGATPALRKEGARLRNALRLALDGVEDARRARARAWKARKRAEDPEGWRARDLEAQRRYRAKHRERFRDYYRDWKRRRAADAERERQSA